MTMNDSEIAAQANVSAANVKGVSPAGGKVLITGAAGFSSGVTLAPLALAFSETGAK